MFNSSKQNKQTKSTKTGEGDSQARAGRVKQKEAGWSVET